MEAKVSMILDGEQASCVGGRHCVMVYFDDEAAEDVAAQARVAVRALRARTGAEPGAASEALLNKFSMVDADDIQFRLQCGINALGAIHECIESGDFAPRSYADGLFAIYDYLGCLSRELRAEVESAFSSAKK